MDLRPYTIEELNARIDKAESDFKAGLGIPSEEVWSELDEEFCFLGHSQRTYCTGKPNKIKKRQIMQIG